MRPFSGWEGVTDTHMHIYEAGYPTRATAHHQPEPGFSAADFRLEMARVGISRAVVVQTAAYGLDNACLVASVAALGRQARGVAMVAPDVSDAQLEALTAAGMVGVRCLLRGLMTWDELQGLAPRLAPFGWHLDVCFNSADFADRLGLLLDLPVDLVIEHCGYDIDDVDSPAMAPLLRLLDAGRTWIKLSTPYRMDDHKVCAYRNIDDVARALIAHAPDRCFWGSNWPHVGFKHLVPEPDTLAFLDRLSLWTDDVDVQRKILIENADKFYGFSG